MSSGSYQLLCYLQAVQEHLRCQEISFKGLAVRVRTCSWCRECAVFCYLLQLVVISSLLQSFAPINCVLLHLPSTSFSAICSCLSCLKFIVIFCNVQLFDTLDVFLCHAVFCCNIKSSAFFCCHFKLFVVFCPAFCCCLSFSVHAFLFI